MLFLSFWSVSVSLLHNAQMHHQVIPLANGNDVSISTYAGDASKINMEAKE